MRFWICKIGYIFFEIKNYGTNNTFSLSLRKKYTHISRMYLVTSIQILRVIIHSSLISNTQPSLESRNKQSRHKNLIPLKIDELDSKYLGFQRKIHKLSKEIWPMDGLLSSILLPSNGLITLGLNRKQVSIKNILTFIFLRKKKNLLFSLFLDFKLEAKNCLQLFSRKVVFEMGHLR